MELVAHGFRARMAQALGLREEQQDSCFVLAKTHHLLLGVFDGMGGHAHARATSQAASQAVQRMARRTQMVQEPSLRAWLERALMDAHEHAARAGGGTTAMVAILDRRQSRVVLGWAGDSSCWLFRNASRPSRLSRPHGMGSHLFNGLGACFDRPEVEVAQVPLAPSDLVLVASDGADPFLAANPNEVARWSRRRGSKPPATSPGEIGVRSLRLPAAPEATDNVTAVFGGLGSLDDLRWVLSV